MDADTYPLEPRPLRHGEQPGAGDLLFESSRAFLSRIIQAGTWSDLNHVAVVVSVDVTTGTLTCAEALGAGFVLNDRPAGTTSGYVVRLTDDPDARRALAHDAVLRTLDDRKYDYLAIAKFGARIASKVRPVTLVGKFLLGALAALVRGIGTALLRVLPAERPDRDICSGAATALLRQVFGATTVLPGVPADEVSPAELFRVLYRRQVW